MTSSTTNYTLVSELAKKVGMDETDVLTHVYNLVTEHPDEDFIDTHFTYLDEQDDWAVTDPGAYLVAMCVPGKFGMIARQTLIEYYFKLSKGDK